jgi:hypothetical protein
MARAVMEAMAPQAALGLMARTAPMVSTQATMVAMVKMAAQAAQAAQLVLAAQVPGVLRMA